ncbi:MAG: hypothetical protein AAF623_04360, partial [Planctomycetota bacterium]
FTPTQRFGVLMLFVLAMALVGDLILLPAILAGPLGKFFGKEKSSGEAEPTSAKPNESETALKVVGPVIEIQQPIKPEVILPPETDLSKNLRKLE